MPIRDLGYKPYEGKRLPHRSRYKVLIRRTLALAWGQGLVKATMIVGAVPMLVCGGIIWLKLQAMKVLAARMVQMGGQAAAQINIDDPVSYVFSCMYWSQLWFAFALSLLVAAPAISGDVRTGAFSFYFARPVDRAHYLLGKVVPAALLVLIIAAVPALLLALLRLALGGAEDAAAVAPKLLSVAAFAPVYAATMVLPPVALSALGRRSGSIQGLWAALFFGPGCWGRGPPRPRRCPTRR